MLWIRREIADPAIDDSTTVGKTPDRFLAGRCRRLGMIQVPDDAFEEKLAQRAAAQCRFRLGAAEQFFRQIDRRLHVASYTPLWFAVERDGADVAGKNVKFSPH